MTSETNPRSQRLTAMDIAMQWAELPPEQFRAALRGIKPILDQMAEADQRRLEHECEMDRARLELEKQYAERQAEWDKRQAELQAERGRREHRTELMRLIFGFVIAVGAMTGAAIWHSGGAGVSAAFAVPGVVPLVAFFVARKAPSLPRARNPTAPPAPPED